MSRNHLSLPLYGCADVTLQPLELAEASGGALSAECPQGLSHHDDGSGWFDGTELSPCVSDWLDGDGGDTALEWCVPVSSPGPVAPGQVFPQSPTSVDWTSGPPSNDANKNHMDANKMRRKTEQVDPSVHEDSDANGVVMQNTTKLEYPSLQDVHVQDDVKVEIDHENWVGSDVHREKKRQRQRGYERTYRMRKRRQSKYSREEWATKEIELYMLMKQRAHSYTRSRGPHPDPRRVKFERHVREEAAQRMDHMLLTTARAWLRLFETRMEDPTTQVLRSHEDWARIDKNMLGPCVIQPFRPFYFSNFEW